MKAKTDIASIGGSTDVYISRPSKLTTFLSATFIKICFMSHLPLIYIIN
jgi:hypothetical protein